MKWILSFFLLFILNPLSWGQDLSLTSSIDRNSILIGEQIQVALKASLPQNSNYQWPRFVDSINGIELVESSKIDSTKKGDLLIISQYFTITSFDSGYFALPPFELLVNGQILKTEVLGLAVLLPETSENKELYDINGQMEPPINWTKIILISIIIALVLAGLIVVLLRIRKNKLNLEDVPKMTLRPYAQARKELDELESQQLWQKGQIKLHYTRVTEILKYYMQAQLKISSIESTAEEIIENIERLGLPRENFAGLKMMLRTGALVKFAKVKPSPLENEEAISVVRTFIDVTGPKIIKSDTDVE